MTPEEADAAIQSLGAQIAELQGRLAELDAHGLTALRFVQLSDHPVHYGTAVPTTTDMTGDGQMRVIHTGGLDYLYVRSNGAIVKVQLT